MQNDHIDLGNGAARRFLKSAVRSVEEQFGAGSAAKMPELIAALVRSAVEASKMAREDAR
jgi:hypothetical protein